MGAREKQGNDLLEFPFAGLFFCLARQWFDGNGFFDPLHESNHFAFI
jgi:hypothetical protein